VILWFQILLDVRDATCYLICSGPIDMGMNNKLIWVICWMVREIVLEIIDEYHYKDQNVYQIDTHFWLTCWTCEIKCFTKESLMISFVVFFFFFLYKFCFVFLSHLNMALFIFLLYSFQWFYLQKNSTTLFQVILIQEQLSNNRIILDTDKKKK